MDFNVSKVRTADIGGIPFYAICNFVKWQLKPIVTIFRGEPNGCFCEPIKKVAPSFECIDICLSSSTT